MVVDTYEMFRIADPWLRHDLVLLLPGNVRFVVAGRDVPMLEWSTERGSSVESRCCHSGRWLTTRPSSFS